jgi:hypothetical protein
MKAEGKQVRMEKRVTKREVTGTSIEWLSLQLSFKRKAAKQ